MDESMNMPPATVTDDVEADASLRTGAELQRLLQTLQGLPGGERLNYPTRSVVSLPTEVLKRFLSDRRVPAPQDRDSLERVVSNILARPQELRPAVELTRRQQTQLALRYYTAGCISAEDLLQWFPFALAWDQSPVTSGTPAKLLGDIASVRALELDCLGLWVGVCVACAYYPDLGEADMTARYGVPPRVAQKYRPSLCLLASFSRHRQREAGEAGDGGYRFFERSYRGACDVLNNIFDSLVFSPGKVPLLDVPCLVIRARAHASMRSAFTSAPCGWDLSLFGMRSALAPSEARSVFTLV